MHTPFEQRTKPWSFNTFTAHHRLHGVIAVKEGLLSCGYRLRRKVRFSLIELALPCSNGSKYPIVFHRSGAMDAMLHDESSEKANANKRRAGPVCRCFACQNGGQR